MAIDDYAETIGEDFKFKTVRVGKEYINLKFWEARKCEDKEAVSLNPNFRNAHGYILIYDTTDLTSFKNLNSWIRKIESKTESRVILVANKTDL